MVIKEIGEDPTHTLFALQPPPRAAAKEERTEKRTREECLTGCIRLSHSETQAGTESCLCGEAQQSAARLPRLCEEGRIGLLLGILNKEKKRNKRGSRRSRAMTGNRRKEEAC